MLSWFWHSPDNNCIILIESIPNNCLQPNRSILSSEIHKALSITNRSYRLNKQYLKTDWNNRIFQLNRFDTIDLWKGSKPSNVLSWVMITNEFVYRYEVWRSIEIIASFKSNWFKTIVYNQISRHYLVKSTTRDFRKRYSTNRPDRSNETVLEDR